MLAEDIPTDWTLNPEYGPEPTWWVRFNADRPWLKPAAMGAGAVLALLVVGAVVKRSRRGRR